QPREVPAELDGRADGVIQLEGPVGIVQPVLVGRNEVVVNNPWLVRHREKRLDRLGNRIESIGWNLLVHEGIADLRSIHDPAGVRIENLAITQRLTCRVYRRPTANDGDGGAGRAADPGPRAIQAT